jgi:hypothetical protein
MKKHMNEFRKGVHFKKLTSESSSVECDGCGKIVHDDDVEIVGDQVLCHNCRSKYYRRNGYWQESGKLTMSNAKAQVNDFLEKIGDYLMVDFDIEDVERYKFGPRIIFEKDGARYYVEVGLTDNQPN